jgi:hypothetical protein
MWYRTTSFPTLALFPEVTRFHVFAHRYTVFRGFRCNMLYQTDKFSDACLFFPKLPASTFSPIVKPFLGVSAVTRGTERVVDKLFDACPFLPEVA